MLNPSLLLLDEPLEGLAPVMVDRLLDALLRLRAEERLAIVIVEQHARLALEFSPLAVILDRGKIVYDDHVACVTGRSATAGHVDRCRGLAGLLSSQFRHRPPRHSPLVIAPVVIAPVVIAKSEATRQFRMGASPCGDCFVASLPSQ